MASNNFRLNHLLTKPGIFRVVFVITGLVGVVIFGVASSNSKVVQQMLTCWNCSPIIWLANVSLAIVIFTWVFPVTMLILSVSPALAKMNGFKSLDFWEHVICGFLLFIAFVLTTTFVIMSMSSSVNTALANPALFGIAGVLALGNSIFLLFTSKAARALSVIIPAGSHDKIKEPDHPVPEEIIEAAGDGVTVNCGQEADVQ